MTETNLDFYRRLRLSEHLDKNVGEMSLGTQKKLMLASGLLGNSSLILMDEPTNGIDAGAKLVLAETIVNRGEDALVFFSTHDKEFIELTGAKVISLMDIQPK